MRELSLVHSNPNQRLEHRDAQITDEQALEALKVAVPLLAGSSTGGIIIRGLEVTATDTPGMCVKIRAGLAALEDNTIVYSSADVEVPIEDGGTRGRRDTLCVQLVKTPTDEESRYVYNPAIKTFSPQNIFTRDNVGLNAQVLQGQPTAPNNPSGWLKLAEIQVAAGNNQAIESVDIFPVSTVEPGEENASWQTDKTATYRLGTLNQITPVVELSKVSRQFEDIDAGTCASALFRKITDLLSYCARSGNKWEANPDIIWERGQICLHDETLYLCTSGHPASQDKAPGQIEAPWAKLASDESIVASIKQAEARAAKDASSKDSKLETALETSIKQAEARAAKDASSKDSKLETALETSIKQAEARAAKDASSKDSKLETALETAIKQAEARAAKDASSKDSKLETALETSIKQAEARAAKDASSKDSKLETALETSIKQAEARAAKDASEKDSGLEGTLSIIIDEVEARANRHAEAKDLSLRSALEKQINAVQTEWFFTKDGTWRCPVSGLYLITLVSSHGYGGGGGGGGDGGGSSPEDKGWLYARGDGGDGGPGGNMFCNRVSQRYSLGSVSQIRIGTSKGSNAGSAGGTGGGYGRAGSRGGGIGGGRGGLVGGRSAEDGRKGEDGEISSMDSLKSNNGIVIPGKPGKPGKRIYLSDHIKGGGVGGDGGDGAISPELFIGPNSSGYVQIKYIGQ